MGDENGVPETRGVAVEHLAAVENRGAARAVEISVDIVGEG